MENSFIGFYPSTLFWANQAPNMDYLQKDSPEFGKELKTVEFSYSSDKFTLQVCRDGLFMVRIEELEDKLENELSPYEKTQIIGQYYEYLNALLLLLESVTMKQGPISLGNTKLQINEAFRMRENGHIIPSKDTDKIILRSTKLANIREAFPTLLHRGITLKTPIFDELVIAFEKVVDDYDKVRILNQVMYASSSYQSLDFSSSLIQSWFVIEYFINLYWLKFLGTRQFGISEDGKWINKDARKFFTDIAFTSSVMSKLIGYANDINEGIFKKIDNLRNKRNSLVHNSELVNSYELNMRKDPTTAKKRLTQTTYEDCVDAFDVIKYFVNEQYKIELDIGTGFRVHSI